MKTINGITWETGDIQERHDSNWVVWSCTGTDAAGNYYEGSVQGFSGYGDSEVDWGTLEIEA